MLYPMCVRFSTRAQSADGYRGVGAHLHPKRNPSARKPGVEVVKESRFVRAVSWLHRNQQADIDPIVF